MQLFRHHTDQGFRCCVVLREGPKWLRVHYVADARPTRIPAAEGRYLKDLGALTPKQRRRFNQAVVAHGGKRGTL